MQRSPIVLSALAFLLSAPPLSAADFTLGPLEIGNPWTRATPKGATVAGGYLTITNKGAAPDRLIGGSAAFSGRFELHEMKVVNGMMQMRPLVQGLEIKPGETVELKPGGLHLMFVDLKQAPQPGERLKGTLKFEKAGEVAIEYAVTPIGSGPPAAHKGH